MRSRVLHYRPTESKELVAHLQVCAKCGLGLTAMRSSGVYGIHLTSNGFLGGKPCQGP